MNKLIAIPVEQGKVCMHFGHCEYFAVYSVNEKEIVDSKQLDAPPHQPGLLPQWLKDRGITDIIACGMGQRAIDLFVASSIRVTIGVEPGMDPKNLVSDYLEGKLKGGGNYCDH